MDQERSYGIIAGTQEYGYSDSSRNEQPIKRRVCFEERLLVSIIIRFITRTAALKYIRKILSISFDKPYVLPIFEPDIVFMLWSGNTMIKGNRLRGQSHFRGKVREKGSVPGL
jgi:hypothetical protein